ncbi:hypothetical protein V6N12_003305 [Hibiscus sabdariffa]|uniref:Uncharacterized protein n=1 Tax=Hibiscus sabdariffa TaxID=183260 RepID=A0ABR2ED91_9ROSI
MYHRFHHLDTYQIASLIRQVPLLPFTIGKNPPPIHEQKKVSNPQRALESMDHIPPFIHNIVKAPNTVLLGRFDCERSQRLSSPTQAINT